MPSLQHEETGLALRRTVIIAIFAAVAVVLSLLETLVPINVSVPGAKLGLANIMVLTCLYFMRGRDAFVVVVLKTLLTSFIFGTFSSFLFSFLGALFSFGVMWLLLKLGRGRLSLIGISVAGGIAHNFGQLAAASIVIRSSVVFYYLPMLVLLGLGTGIVVGIAVRVLVPALAKLSLFEGFLGVDA
ncbi:heptaprenyl diphosphate synthase [Paenibacillus yonginensis]|uniref:Heptaprenyl diphosphate synthase n=1 Tax=Paenibacillus yonginensis TaxID=1462996 RepID=A0A1B1N5U7_9BACL|nr:Gx transporter family protein [Paenibacillus yonginensis]ANS76821.1 heptaprenyl diphosphate synthase [Paenibacillus yonginensis]